MDGCIQSAICKRIEKWKIGPNQNWQQKEHHNVINLTKLRVLY